MGLSDIVTTIRQAADRQKNPFVDIGATVGEVASGLVNQPEVQDVINEAQQQEEQRNFHPWNYARSDNQVDEDKRMEAAGLIENIKDAYKNASNRDTEDLEEELKKPTENTRLMPAFEKTNDSSYNPMSGFIGNLDSLSLEDQQNPVTKDTNAIYEGMEGFTDQTEDKTMPHFWDMLTAMSESAQATESAQGNINRQVARQQQAIADEANQRAYDEMNQWLTNARTTAVDDGTSDARNLNSNYMTGERYLQYIENGVPNNLTADQVEDIRNHPDTIYNKRNEMLNNGFVPYVPNDAAYGRMILENAIDQPSRWGSWLRNLRDNSTDYKMRLNGNEYSGEQVEDMDKWVHANAELIDQINNGEDNILTDKTADHSKDTPYTTYSKFVIDDGTEMSVPITGAKFVNEGEVFQDETGLFVNEYGDPTPLTVQFVDGNQFDLDSMDDYNQIFNSGNLEYLPAPEGMSPEGVDYWYPNYEMNDGTTVSLPDAFALYNASQGEPDPDNPVEFDYSGNIGPIRVPNWSKPASQIQSVVDSEGFHPENVGDILPQFADLLTASAPYFTTQTSLPYAVSNAHIASITGDPMTMDEYGNVQPIASDIDNQRYFSSVAANAAMPATEFGFGRIGNSAFKAPFQAGSRLMNRLGERSWIPAAQHIFGTIGEGAEEIGGNVVEEFTTQGPRTWYGNEILDEEGNPVVDPITGNVLKEANTPLPQRFRNFAKDIPEAVYGGMLLGGAMGIPEIPSTLKTTKRYMANNREDRENGYISPRIYVNPNSIEVTPLSDNAMRYLLDE